MGQQEAYSWLKEQYKIDKSKWFKSSDISKGTNQSLGSTTDNLKRLRISGMIKSRIRDDFHNGYEYQYILDAEYKKLYY